MHAFLVIALPTFIIFINDLVDICGENIILYVFADDAKVPTVI